MCGVKLDLNTTDGFWINVRCLSVPLDHLKCAILIRKDKNFSRKPVALISVSNSTDRIILRKKWRIARISIPRHQTFEIESWWLFEYDQIRAHTCDLSSEISVTTTTKLIIPVNFLFLSCFSWSVNKKQLGQMRELCLKIMDEKSLYSSFQGEGQIGLFQVLHYECSTPTSQQCCSLPSTQLHNLVKDSWANWILLFQDL